MLYSPPCCGNAFNTYHQREKEEGGVRGGRGKGDLHIKYIKEKKERGVFEGGEGKEICILNISKRKGRGGCSRGRGKGYFLFIKEKRETSEYLDVVFSAC